MKQKQQKVAEVKMKSEQHNQIWLEHKEVFQGLWDIKVQPIDFKVYEKGEPSVCINRKVAFHNYDKLKKEMNRMLQMQIIEEVKELQNGLIL